MRNSAFDGGPRSPGSSKGCLGMRPTLQRCRTECASPRKHLSRVPWGLHGKAFSLWPTPAEGRSPHARYRGFPLTEGCPHWATLSGAPTLAGTRSPGLARPLLACMRLCHADHRVRTFEKTGPRAIPQVSPSLAWPLGGAGSARPQESPGPHPGMFPLGPFSGTPTLGGTRSPGLARPLLACMRLCHADHRVRTFEKTGPRAIPQELGRLADALLIRTRRSRR